jgi:putative two-component system response regulator
MSEHSIQSMQIWIADDQDPNVLVLEKILQRADYKNLRSFRDSREVLPAFLSGQPDILLLDLKMPHLDGLAVMKQIGPHIRPHDFFPILVLIGDALPGAKRDALSNGAKDFLTKPFDATEVLLRTRTLLEMRALNGRLLDLSENLEARVAERTTELENVQFEMLERLSKASEFRDDETGKHTQRVGFLAGKLAQAAGLPPERCDLIRRAAKLHDVGKIGVRDTVLLKPGRLTPEEFELMKSHTAWGAEILGGSNFPVMQLAAEIAMHHHERWDGNGYHGLAGEEIPIEARMVTLADVFDVLTHSRPYKEAWPVEAALAEIRRGSGRMFDPQLTATFLSDSFRESLAHLGQALAAAGSGSAPARTTAVQTTVG